MAEYDAFGRRKGEDTLAGLGGGKGGGRTPTPQPVAPERKPAPTPLAKLGDTGAGTRVSGIPGTSVRRVSGSGYAILGILAIVVVGGIGVAIASVVSSVSDTVRHVPSFTFSTPSIPSIPTPATSTPSTPSAPPAAGLGARSLLRPVALRRAVRDLGTGGFHRVRLVRVTAERVDAQLVAGGRTRIASLTPAGRRVVTTTSPGAAPTAVPAGAIDYAAPARIARTAARRMGVSTDRVDSATFIVLSGALPDRWTVRFDDGALWTGDRHGRDLRRLN